MLEGQSRFRLGAGHGAWTTARWCFLTVGIALGSWWAYYELGWGGWWFWDRGGECVVHAVAAGTALIHSLAVTEKRGLFKSWTPAARDHRVLAEPARHVPRAFGCADLRACVSPAIRSAAADIPPVPRCNDRLRTPALRMACAGPEERRRLHAALARDLPAGEQRAADRRHGTDSDRHTLSSVSSTPSASSKQSVGPPYFEVVFLIPMLPLVLLLRRRHARRVEACSMDATLLRFVRVPLALALIAALLVRRWLYGRNTARRRRSACSPRCG